MGRPKLGERITGPYCVHNGWRIDHHDGRGGVPRAQIFATEAQAKRAKEGYEREIARKNGTTVADAIDQYKTYLRDIKGNKPKSYVESVRVVRAFFEITEDDDGGTLASVSAKQCQARYDVLASQLAVDSHRGYLNTTKTFMRWCLSKRWIQTNPLETVQGRGRRKKGKPQLRIDEARKWDAAALELAATEQGALAALLALYLGLRASEVVQRQVRDVDDGCSVFWIPETKTDAGRRRLRVPEQLRPLLQALVDGRGSEEWLFKGRCGKPRNRRWISDWAAHICTVAGVPKICAHSLRGMHGSLAETEGETGAAVARALGHASTEVTHEHYVAPEAQAAGKQRRMMGVLHGGRK